MEYITVQYSSPSLALGPFCTAEDVQAGAFGDLQRFNADELAEACNEFSDDNFIGEGPNATVYKGFLENGTPVAVKKYKTVRPSWRMEHQWRSKGIGWYVHSQGLSLLTLPGCPS